MQLELGRYVHTGMWERKLNEGHSTSELLRVFSDNAQGGMYVRMYVCTYVCVYVCMYVSMYVSK